MQIVKNVTYVSLGTWNDIYVLSLLIIYRENGGDMVADLKGTIPQSYVVLYN